MTFVEGQSWVHPQALCEHGHPVEFRPKTFTTLQGGVRRFDAVCPVDPSHKLGREAERMLAQVRRDNP